jgi:thiamine biosynthesis protein ThiI
VSSSQVLPEPEFCLVRYGELALKGGNRVDFERRLAGNIRAALRSISPARVERLRGRMVVTPEGRVTACAQRLRDVFGISSISPAWKSASRTEDLIERSRAVLARTLEEFEPARCVRVCVRAKRSDKRFPLTSAELERTVASQVLPGRERVRVDLTDPELTLGIDVRAEGCFVYASRLSGPGGLPVGTLGRGVCLISGGIDSPVAAWMAMKRGLELVFLTFHSYPWVGEPARKKVVDLVKILARFQPRTRLIVAPFAHVNIAVREAVPDAYRTVMYRRMMQRIAARLAEREQARALVTGESLGQVASQTVENLTAIGSASATLVVRPLIGFDKEETIRVARRIGTFDLSAVQEPDCCTVFLPARPILRADPRRCAELEQRIDVAELVDRSISEAECLDLDEGAPYPP